MYASFDYVKRVVPETAISFQAVPVPVPDPVLLIHADGIDGSPTFIDSSPSGHTITTIGAAQIDTADFKFGSGSILFDGASARLTLDGSTDFSYGTGDFTIDWWVHFNSLTNQQGFYLSDVTGNFFSVQKRDISNVFTYYNGAEVIIGTTPVSTAGWNHVALTRAANNVRLFLNGTQEGSTYVETLSFGISAGFPNISLSGQLVNGWVDEFHIIKGYAMWTSDFTPPTAPYSPP